MAGEQEEVVRYSVSAGMKFAKHIMQLIKDIEQDRYDKWEAMGGEVDYEYLNQDGYALNKIDITHLEDFDQFDKFAKENGVQFAITEDYKNPDIEHLWFKAKDQETLKTFMQEIFDYGDEINKEIDPEKIIDPEELIKQKHEEQEYIEEVKYKLREQDYENHEYRMQSFQSFDEMKAHLVENYDDLLRGSETEVPSFNDVHSTKQLENVLNKMDQSKITLKLERKPLLQEFAEKSKELTANMKNIAKDKIKHKVPEKDGR